MFVCLSVCLSVRLEKARIVIIRYTSEPIQVVGYFKVLGTLTRFMFAYSRPSFSSSTWKTGGAWTCKLGVISQEGLKIEVKLLLSANNK